MWYQKKFQRWDGGPALWPVRIPRGLKKGLYMVRHEILSIHVGGRPQFYPECAHLNVTEGGEVVVPEEWTRRFPGAYDDDGEYVAGVEGSVDKGDVWNVGVRLSVLTTCRRVGFHRHLPAGI